MEKFNNTTLFTGYLKQLLHNFNLPKYKIYTQDQAEYFKKYGQERFDVIETVTKDYDNSTQIDTVYPNQLRYVPYIKNGFLQMYVDGKWIPVGSTKGNKVKHQHPYNYGSKILNYTKTLKITGNSYDYYTHEYLGDYLRFKRDYLNIDLMPLYNCFSNRVCPALDIKISKTIAFNTEDKEYKIYMLPVKLFKEYTIALDSDTPVEVCCGLYGKYQDTRDKAKNIPGLTYERFSICKFNQPFLYSGILNLNNLTLKNSVAELAQNESELKLFIKVPADLQSTIVVLEGNYIGWNDKISTSAGKNNINNTAINFEHMSNEFKVQLTTPLQLLMFNTKEQHPFADRLIEYLSGNAITSEDEIADNIERVQKIVKAATENFEKVDGKANPAKYIIQEKGVWDPTLNYYIYDYMNNEKARYNAFGINHDILGYVDKDAEKYYAYKDTVTGTDVSILNADLEEEN